MYSETKKLNIFDNEEKQKISEIKTDDFDFGEIQDYMDEEHKLKIDYDNLVCKYNKLESEFNKLYSQNILLKSRIKYLEKNKSLIKKQRQISNEQVQEIKNLRQQGLSYREIETKTTWSKFTINRVLNGFYDL